MAARRRQSWQSPWANRAKTRRVARGTPVAEREGMDRHALLAIILAVTACGSVESGGPPDADHTADGGGSSGSPPTVTAVDPPSGSRVPEDLAIAITFSEAMDRASVEAAIEFPGGAAPSFEWSEDGSRVTASRLVPYPEGSGPEQVEPGVFHVELAAGAADAEGDRVSGALELEYTLRYRRITTSFPFSQTLSGNCDAACSGNFTWFAAGERSSDPTVATRGFVTIPFDLPDDIAIEHAELATEIEQILDNPFSFGDLMIDHVVFDAFTGDLYGRRGAGLGVLYARADMPAAGDAALVDVTDVLTDDYQHRAERQHRSQYRIRFPHDLAEDPSYPTWHADGAWDVVELLRPATSLSVTYLVE
jgi:hypothetical protein